MRLRCLAGIAFLANMASAQPAYDRLLKAEGEPQNWLTYSGSYRSWRYSSLEPDRSGQRSDP